MLGKVKYYKTGKKAITPETMAAFMMSPKGYYGNDTDCAVLAALDNAKTYPERAAFWAEVSEVLRFWNFTSKGKGN